MSETYTSRGTIIENKAIIKSGTFDINDFITQSDTVINHIEEICKHKGVSPADYIDKLPDVSQDLVGIFKDSENKARRAIQTLYPITGDRSDPEIRSLRLFGDLLLDFIVSYWEERVIDYAEPVPAEPEYNEQGAEITPENGLVSI